MENDPLARVDRLERHVTRLDTEIAELKARLDRVATSTAPVRAPAPPVVPAPDARWAPPTPVAPTPHPTAWSKPHVPPRRPDRVSVAIDSETLLKWGGVGLVLLAVGFAVSTAISRDWIGPELQLAGAVLVGLGLVGAGLRLRRTRPGWTHALCSGGVLALFITFASDLFLDQASDNVAFVATVAIGAGGVVLARVIGSEWVAVATLAGGAIGWAVIGRGDPPFAATLAWYVAIVAVMVFVAIEQRWFGVRLAAHGTSMVAFLALAGESQGSTEQLLLGIATVLVAGSLFAVPSVGDLSSVWQQLEVQLAAAATPWAFGVTFESTLEPERDAVIGWTAIAIAALAAVIAIELRTRIRPAHVVSLLIGASVTLSIGLAVLLSTEFTFVALAVQGAGLVFLGRALDHNIRVLVNAAVVTSIAALFVVANMIDAWANDASVGDDIAHALIIAVIAFACWQTREQVVLLIGAFATLVLTLIWLGSVLVHLPQGQAVVSVSWAIVGTAVFVLGAVRRHPEMGATGLAVLGLTVGKLLTVDLREVDTLWRAGLFFLVGVGLMRLGFLLPRLARDDDTDDEPSIEPADPTASPLERR